jgi:hypothetical protein
MGVVPFDTLKLARRLESAGFAPKHAGGNAEALAEAMSGAELATTGDIIGIRSELKAEITALRVELRAEIASVRAEIAGVGSELKADLELLRRNLIIRLGSMLVVAVGILLAAMRYLPPTH